MFSYFRFICLCCLLFFPSLAAADIPTTDKSMQYLGTVFGTMGSLPLVSANNVLFSQLMLLFNQVVLTLAILIVVYTAVVSTIHTAHEGEVMGKKWSSIFIPARIGAGLWLLVPASSGYSYIQIVIMWFLIQGVSVANSLWEQVLMAYDRGEGIYDTTDVSGLSPSTTISNTQGDQNVVRGILRAQVCMQLVNNNPENLEQINQGIPLTAFLSADGTQVMWGIQSTQQPICGVATLPTPTVVNQVYNSISDTTNNSQFNQFQAQLGDLLLTQVDPDLQSSALEIATQPSGDWTQFSNLVTAQSNFTSQKQNLLTQVQTGGASPVTSTIAKNALADGWIHAGSYYAKLIAGNQSPIPSNLTIQVNPPNFSLIGGGDLGQSIMQRTDTLTNAYLAQASQLNANVNANGSQTRGTTGGSGLAWPFNEIVDSISSPLWGMAKWIMQRLSARENTDPMLSISKTGGEIVFSTEALFLGFLSLSLIGFALSWFMGTGAPGHVFVVGILSIFMPFFMLLLAFLYTAGVMLALYIPLIPFLVFTFSSITWMILVIEAIVAAPLVAMILVVPSEDELGKAGYAIVILVGLILRPALMILGFIVAIKLLLIGVKILNFGFSSVAYEHLPPFSIFFPIAVIVLYASILTYIVHEAFSLIYIIPDKVLRWMGGTPEGEDIMGKVKKSEGDAEKGAGSAKGAIGSISSAGKGGAQRGRKKSK